MPIAVARAALVAALTLSLAPVPLLAEPPAPATTNEAAPKPVALELVTPARAARLVARNAVHVLDLRPVARYLAGHIPTAVHIDDECLRGSASGRPAQLLLDADLAQVLECCGVTEAKPLLVYSDGEDPLAATLMAYAAIKAGHPRVMILDGGFAAWQGNHPTSFEYGTYERATWSAAPRTTLAVSLDEVRTIVDDDTELLVDARPAKFFRGETKAWPRNGHIPGAVNLDWKQLVDKDNEALLKPRAEIAKILADAGLKSSQRIVVYCGTGREATLLFLVLKGMLEWPNVRLYEGSWTEWSAHAELPVAEGGGPRVTVHKDGNTWIGSQPTEASLQELLDEGLATIINCRSTEETASLEFRPATFAKKYGLRYVEIPLGGTQGYDAEAVAALKAALDGSPKGKVLLHCASGGRAGQLWLAHLVRNEGLTLEAARERMRTAGALPPSTLERLLGAPTEQSLKAPATPEPAKADVGLSRQ
jgi:thiosulfate/3-mercaptopyruvate sulfurtransferase